MIRLIWENDSNNVITSQKIYRGESNLEEETSLEGFLIAEVGKWVRVFDDEDVEDDIGYFYLITSNMRGEELRSDVIYIEPKEDVVIDDEDRIYDRIISKFDVGVSVDSHFNNSPDLIFKFGFGEDLTFSGD